MTNVLVHIFFFVEGVHGTSFFVSSIKMIKNQLSRPVILVDSRKIIFFNEIYCFCGTIEKVQKNKNFQWILSSERCDFFNGFC